MITFSAMQPHYYSWWELVGGCTPISLCCKNCFGKVESCQLQAMGIPRYKNGFKFVIHEAELERIHYFLEKVKKPHCFFSINPLSDLLQSRVPDEFILEVFRIIRKYMGCYFKIITKRSERLMELSHRIPNGLSLNLVIGISVESPDQYYRIDHLRRVHMPNGGKKGISLAPLLSSMPDLPLEGIGEVTCCDERGDNARPAKREWVDDIKRQCTEAMLKFVHPIRFFSVFNKPLVTPPHYYRWAMVTQLLKSTGGMMAFMTRSNPRWKEYFEIYSKYRHTPFPYDDLREKVRQVAPEFFEE